MPLVPQLAVDRVFPPGCDVLEEAQAGLLLRRRARADLHEASVKNHLFFFLTAIMRVWRRGQTLRFQISNPNTIFTILFVLHLRVLNFDFYGQFGINCCKKATF